MSHDPHGNPHLQHHFDNMGHQFGAAKLGMWLFLAQEVLFFGGLFCAYIVYRVNHPELYEYAYQWLDEKWGAINTVVLLVSSLTMALGVRCAQLSQRRGLLINLALTFLCAGGFMVIKYVEYSAKVHHGTLPGRLYRADKVLADVERSQAAHAVDPAPGASAGAADPAGKPGVAFAAVPEGTEPTQILAAAAQPAGFRPAPVTGHAAAKAHEEHGGEHHLVIQGPMPDNLPIFFGIYFCLTGLHGIHVLGGMVMLVWLFVGAWKGRYNKDFFTPVDLGGLYWHLVDLVWIFLFPLLYLIR